MRKTLWVCGIMIFVAITPLSAKGSPFFMTPVFVTTVTESRALEDSTPSKLFFDRRGRGLFSLTTHGPQHSLTISLIRTKGKGSDTKNFENVFLENTARGEVFSSPQRDSTFTTENDRVDHGYVVWVGGTGANVPEEKWAHQIHFAKFLN